MFGITSSLMFRLQPEANGGSGSGSITQIGNFKPPHDTSGATQPNVGFTSTAVMYDTGRILQVGGNGITDNNRVLASQQATIIDINGAAPVVAETAPRANRRHWAHANVLPGSLTAAALAGRGVFEQNNCASCHGGLNFSSSALSGGMRGLSSLQAGSGNRLGVPLTGLDVPTLVAYLRSLDSRDPAPLRPLPDGVYRLLVQHSGMALQVLGDSTASGAAAVQADWLGQESQRWRLARQADGGVIQTNVATGKVLNVSRESLASGAAVIQGQSANLADERWYFGPVSPNTVAAGRYAAMHWSISTAASCWMWLASARRMGRRCSNGHGGGAPTSAGTSTW